MMRSLLFKLLGAGSIALGGLILGGQVTLPRSEQVLDIGVIRATAHTRETLPQWVGFGALAIGTALLLTAGAKRDS
jgi:hypothetical protein